MCVHVCVHAHASLCCVYVCGMMSMHMHMCVVCVCVHVCVCIVVVCLGFIFFGECLHFFNLWLNVARYFPAFLVICSSNIFCCLSFSLLLLEFQYTHMRILWHCSFMLWFLEVPFFTLWFSLDNFNRPITGFTDSFSACIASPYELPEGVFDLLYVLFLVAAFPLIPSYNFHLSVEFPLLYMNTVTLSH